MPILALAAADLDLSAPDAAAQTRELPAPGRCARVPFGTHAGQGTRSRTFMRNLRMGEAVAGALQARPVAHVVYVSSDAVYPYDTGLVTETTPAAPSTSTARCTARAS